MKELETYLYKMLTKGTEIIFKDDFEEERFFEMYSENNFILGE